MTRWAADVHSDNARPEYPRPQMVRDSWMNLNGLWEYAIVHAEDGVPDQYDGTILVPFPIEAALSGVGRTPTPDDVLHYRTSFRVPDEWQSGRVLLHFEAVDWQTEVQINGRTIGIHRGGYDPFSLDITGALSDGSQELVVMVSDPTDKGYQPVGKQVLEPGGIFYTSVTGIWQTVWLEWVPDTYIDDIRFYPDIDTGELGLDVLLAGDVCSEPEVSAAASAGDMDVVSKSGPADLRLQLLIPEPHLWSPNDPFLYDLDVVLNCAGIEIDGVRSYFGMRKISIETDDEGFRRIFLNNEFVFQNGPLDQGFWPDGIYTQPTEEAMRFDLETVKALGFNMLRKHVKIEPRRFYALADEIGLLVWQDMPNGDQKIRPGDADFVRSAESAAQFEFEIRRLIESRFNHPSIVVWVPFNEGWGQYDTARITDWVKELDPTRLVNATSGWSDRGTGDIYDLHHYPEPISPEPESYRAIVLGEFGGLGLPTEGHMWEEKEWGYSNMESAEQLLETYRAYYEEVRRFEREKGLSASIYTQLTDVETEANGLMTYDRKVLKLPLDEAARINSGRN